MRWAEHGTVFPDVVRRIPQWLHPVADFADGVHAPEITHLLPTDDDSRHSAVLVLFGEGDRGPDLLILQRASDMRRHAGQPAFPGGAVDPDDDDAIAAALREAFEETGLDPDGVVPFGLLPDLFLPSGNFAITPVLAWWQRPTPVHAATPAEVASVHRVPIADLVDPRNRLVTRHASGFVGAAFDVEGLLVWGFTARLIDVILTRAGWAVPWDRDRVVEIGRQR